MAIINVPAPAGSALAGQIQMQSMQGLGQALGMYLGQKRQGQFRQQDIQALQGMGQSQDIFNTMYGARGLQAPQAQFPTMQSRLGQQLALQGQLGNIFQKPMLPTQQIASRKLAKIDSLQKKVRAGTASENEKVMLEKMLAGQPLVQIGERLLPPEDRIRGAQADLEKKLAQEPMTPTEIKGVQTTIKEIMGEGETLPFGARLGPALSQEDMNTRWESAMEATGYEGRNEVQKKQINNEFDRHIAILNKGKGLGTLKGQYQWDRRKYGMGTTREIPKRLPQTRTSPNIVASYMRPRTKAQFDSTLRSLAPKDKQAYINKYWRPEFGSHID